MVDGRQIPPGLILAPTARHEAVSVPDTFQRTVAERQVELANQAASSEGGKLTAQLDDLLLDPERRFPALMVGRAGAFDQARRPRLLIAPQPLAHRGHGGLEDARRRLDAVFTGIVDETELL